MSADTVHARLDAIRAAIDEARATVDEGGDVELAGIEDAVSAVCADIAEGGTAVDRATLEPAIRDLIAQFDALAETLGDRHRRTISGTGLDAAARAAYGAERDPGDGSEGGS